MAAKGVMTLVWDMFENSGGLQYYMLFRALHDKDLSLNERERRRREIERLTR